jgi:pentatricopeptide repeat protein
MLCRAGQNIAPDIVSFNSVVAAYVSAGQLQEAYALLNAVTVTPNTATYKMLLDAAHAEQQWDMARHAWHLLMQAMLPPDIDLVNAHLDCMVRSVRHSLLCCSLSSNLVVV